MSSRLQSEAPAWFPEVRAVLFDLDGTLVDSDAAVERAWRRWAEEFGGGERLETNVASWSRTPSRASPATSRSPT